jgi:hypothetical protein
MSDNTMDLYLIQDPNGKFEPPKPGEDHPRDAVELALKYYQNHGKNPVPVRNIHDFVARIHFEVATRKKYIRRLIIGSHGTWDTEGPERYHLGWFWIGNTQITRNSEQEFALLRTVSTLLTHNADVYIVACRTGRDTDVLQAVSKALGGVRVHGYTEYITFTNWLVKVEWEDGTERGGSRVVCVPGACWDRDRRRTHRRGQP